MSSPSPQRRPPRKPAPLSSGTLPGTLSGTIDPAILSDLSALRQTPLTILRLSDPITSNIPSSRRSSAHFLDYTTPSSLTADLEHYKALFAKLRFSYVEQVTKEKFIRSIVGDPPLIVEHGDNAALLKENLAAKARLKELKVEVQGIVEELERKGRELSRRSEKIDTDVVMLGELPEVITHLEESVTALREENKEMTDRAGGNPDLILPLDKTLDAVYTRRTEIATLDKELELLRAQVPRRQRDLELLQKELAKLEEKKTREQAAAIEAKRRKEAVERGGEDEVEDRGRWYKASEAVLKGIFAGDV